MSLVNALNALFSPLEGESVTVTRFWSLLSENLIVNLDIDIFPALSTTIQVNGVLLCVNSGHYVITITSVIYL